MSDKKPVMALAWIDGRPRIFTFPSIAAAGERKSRTMEMMARARTRIVIQASSDMAPTVSITPAVGLGARILPGFPANRRSSPRRRSPAAGTRYQGACVVLVLG